MIFRGRLKDIIVVFGSIEGYGHGYRYRYYNAKYFLNPQNWKDAGGFVMELE